MPSQIQTHSTDTPEIVQRPVRRRQGNPILAILLLIALIGLILEYFGALNLIPNFGRRGKPAITLGLWKPAQLTDVAQGNWASPYVQDLTQKGIVRGYPDGKFRPNEPVTRAEFATMLQVAFNSTPTPSLVRLMGAFFDPQVVSANGGFRDVSSDYWAASAIADVKAKGFLSGFPDDEFRPEQPISKANALVAIANSLGLKRNTATNAPLWFYRDAAQIPAYAKDQIVAATEAGIQLRQSQPPLLRPNQALTRAEAAALLDQALEQAQ
ncbi:S-layer homology domain-containing protein (plasmid) [Kovacikia minuta CCNUW1]|uniref:S-layer homology domain-containing protein n=1 Tax=Kovacikia minuta TaxID=2931930 RepID=UPI001CCE19A0|nr:S-layer homology domain-containing protein [Kovacikia minuta]UBF30680.1 S-layer homology domain-containing protein [Kovacikia minuta CCNUW1]